MRVLLILGRISNLPTVWSNCLAAWWLAGGGSPTRLVWVCFGATFLYTGGMFLNDAVDEPFDRRYRPERPIVSGKISSRAVWLWAIAWLIAGWGIFLYLGKMPALVAGVLVLMIVIYDIVHKQTLLAPLLMAACRFLLYLVAASGIDHGTRTLIVWRAGALAAYIIGLSYLARGESTGGRSMRWSLVLLFAPAVVAILMPVTRGVSLWLVLGIQCAWTVWCLAAPQPHRPNPIPRGVAGLLAGIALVDALAAVGNAPPLVFFGLFVLAVITQRIAPAT